MKLSQAGQVLKGPFFACKRSEGASFFVSRHIHHGNAHRSGLPIRPAASPSCELFRRGSAEGLIPGWNKVWTLSSSPLWSHFSVENKSKHVGDELDAIISQTSAVSTRLPTHTPRRKARTDSEGARQVKRVVLARRKAAIV